jgi:hypothetical protein
VKIKVQKELKKFIKKSAVARNEDSASKLKKVSSVIKEINTFLDDKSELSTKEIEKSLSHLIGYYTITLDIPSDDVKLLRARKSKVGRDKKPLFKKVSELSYPPSKDASMGRCNKEKESIFYGCLYFDDKYGGFNVAFCEVEALKNERINILKSKSSKALLLRYIGIFDHILRDSKPYFIHDDIWEYYKEVYKYMKSKFNKEMLVAYQICDAFFADIFRRKGSNKLYRVTSILSSFFLESSKADGIIYTSVKAEGSPVVALSTEAVDSKIKHLEAISFKISQEYGYAQYKANKLHEGKIDSSGNIAWA